MRNAVTIIVDEEALQNYYTNIAPFKTPLFSRFIDELGKKFEISEKKMKRLYRVGLPNSERHYVSES